MPQLWTDIDGEPWLDNPRRKRRRRRTTTRHRRARRRAKEAPVARAHRRRRRRHSFRRNPESHRTRVRAARRGARHRRRYHRNPLGGGMMRRVTEGLKGGVGVVLGKAAARAIPTFIGQPRTGPIGIGLQALAAVVLTPVVAKFAGGEFGKAFLYGGFAAPLEGLAVGMNIPILSPALSSYPDELRAIPYVPGALRGLSVMSDEEDSGIVM